MCVCVCVCVCERKRGKEGDRDRNEALLCKSVRQRYSERRRGKVFVRKRPRDGDGV
jgi:hypothetical protein